MIYKKNRELRVFFTKKCAQIFAGVSWTPSEV